MRRLFFVLFLLPAVSAAAAQAPAFLEMRTDPRFELLAMVQLLAGAERGSSAFFRHDIPYDRAAQAWFRPYARHPVVEKYQELSSAGFHYLEMYDFLFRMSEPPELELAWGKVPSLLVAHGGGAQSLSEFRALLADFARVSRFGAFYEGQKKERERLVAQAAAPTLGADLTGVFRRYTGWEPPARYTVIVSAFAEPALSVTFQTKDPDGATRLTSLYGPEEEAGAVHFRFETRFAGLWLELAGLKLATESLPYASRLEKSAALYAPLGKACAATWHECAQRHIAFAVGARLLARQGGERLAEEWPVKYARIGMPYLAPLVEKLKEYEARRDLYPTLTDFYPKLLDAFDELGAQHLAAPPFLGGFADAWLAEGPAAFILPKAASRELRAAVAALRARRRPKAEMLDDEEAMKTPLKGRVLIVVGAPGENAWLARRWGDLNLPARFEEGGLRFNPRSGEEAGASFSGRLGYATTALNPDDSSRPALVYTGAGSAEARLALESDPGPADYAVLLGTGAVKVGVYEKSRLPWRLK